MEYLDSVNAIPGQQGIDLVAGQQQVNIQNADGSNYIDYNNKSTRLIIWSLIYCIIFIAQLNRNGVILAILNGDNHSKDPYKASYRLIVIAHVCYLISAIWILLDRP